MLRSNKFFLLVGVLAIVFSIASIPRTLAGSTTFRFTNETGYDGISIQYVISPLSDAINLPYDGRAWEHRIEHDFAGWSVDPTFVIQFRRAQRGWPIRFPPFSIAIPVHITKLAPERVSLPIHLFTSLASSSVERVERLTRSDQMFERRVLSEQMYRYLISKINNPDDRSVRRAVNLWFDSSFQLTTKVAGIFLPDEEAMLAATQSFSPSTEAGERFRRLAGDWKSLFWNDIHLLTPLLTSGRCEEAAALIAYVENKHAAAPEFAVYRLGETPPDTYLAERRHEHEMKCGRIEGQGSIERPAIATATPLPPPSPPPAPG